jgi:hypothetical protein
MLGMAGGVGRVAICLVRFVERQQLQEPGPRLQEQWVGTWDECAERLFNVRCGYKIVVVSFVVCCCVDYRGAQDIPIEIQHCVI